MLFQLILPLALVFSAARTPVPLDEFWQRLEATQVAVASASDPPAAEDSAQWEQMAGAWESVNSVQLADGTIIPVDTKTLSEALRRDPPNKQAVLQTIDALLADKYLTAPPSHRAEDLRALHALLPKTQLPTGPNPIQQIFDSITRFFDQLLAQVSRNPVTSSGGFWILFAGILILALFLFVFFLLRGTLLRFVAESTAPPELNAQEDRLSSESAIRLARERSRSGDYRSAVRFLYLSALLRLEEQGILPVRRSQTNREYLRSVADRPALAATLRNVIDVFDRVWYGYEPLEEDAFRGYAAQVEDLQNER